jgi:hypothetical protein
MVEFAVEAGCEWVVTFDKSATKLGNGLAITLPGWKTTTGIERSISTFSHNLEPLAKNAMGLFGRAGMGK